GGNRKGKFNTYINLMITMLLGGLWHGASLKFMVWGGLHGMALAIHKFITEIKAPLVTSPLARNAATVVGALLTFHFVCFCWVFFRASSMESSWLMITQITQNFKG